MRFVFEGVRLGSLMGSTVQRLKSKVQGSALNMYFCVLPFAFSLLRPLPVDYEILCPRHLPWASLRGRWGGAFLFTCVRKYLLGMTGAVLTQTGISGSLLCNVLHYAGFIICSSTNHGRPRSDPLGKRPLKHSRGVPYE